jgi:hypothetical protein
MQARIAIDWIENYIWSKPGDKKEKRVIVNTTFYVKLDRDGTGPATFANKETASIYDSKHAEEMVTEWKTKNRVYNFISCKNARVEYIIDEQI